MLQGMHALTVLPVSLASVIRAFPEEDKKKAEFGDGNLLANIKLRWREWRLGFDLCSDRPVQIPVEIF